MSLWLILILLISGALAVWLYGDQIQQQIIKNLNTQINTPIKVSQIDVSLWSNFPNLTINLGQVEVQESYEFAAENMLEVKNLELMFNPLQIIKQDYSVSKIRLSDGKLKIEINRNGQPNYIIFKSNEANPDQESYFSLEKMYLENIDFTYQDKILKQQVHVLAQEMAASLDKRDSLYRIEYQGTSLIHAIEIGEVNYLSEKEIWSSSKVNYNPLTQSVYIEGGDIRFKNSEFLLSGEYHMQDRGRIDLNLQGKETDINNLLVLLPESVYSQLAQYNSSGKVYFEMDLQGRLSSTESPTISAHFGCENATITHPDTGLRINNASFDGYYVSNSFTDLVSAELSLKNMSGTFDSRPFKGSILIRNFTDKFLKFDLESVLSLEKLLAFYPNESIQSAYGTVDADISFEGRLSDLKQRSTMGNIVSSGQIVFDSVGLDFQQVKLPFEKLNGALLFNNQNIAMNDFSGVIGKSDFKLNGILTNIFSFLLLEENDISVDAQLNSSYLDIDELLTLGVVEKQQSASAYSLNISPLLSLNFDCKVGKAVFRRFSGQDISGVLKIKDQLAMFQNIRFKESGGIVSLEGVVDAKGETVDIMTRFLLNDIYLDSMFYVFEDFNQDFLRYSHLSGKIRAEISAFMQFTPDLIFLPNTLVADLSVSINEGGLRNFEPLQLLAPYLPKDDLQDLKFAELKNDIHIEGQKVYIPQMKISSNVTEITIGGTHTFDQHINYKIIAPLFNKTRFDRDELYGAIEEDGTPPPKIHLLLTGTTDDYKISLDREGQKNQVVQNLKKEVTELKNAFKKKQKAKKETLQLDEEEYFDWEDH